MYSIAPQSQPIEVAAYRAEVRTASASTEQIRWWAVLAHLALQNPNLGPFLESPAISLAARHAKVRREGYAR